MVLRHQPDFIEQQSILCAGVNRPDLPLGVESCGRYAAAGRYFVTRQGLDSYLLMHTRSGRGVLTLEDRRYTLTPDTCVVVDCRARHDYRTAADTVWRFDWVHFSGSEADWYFRGIGGAPVYGCGPPVFSRIHACQNRPHRDLHEHKALTDILYAVLCAKHAENSALNGIPALMEAHIGSPLSLEDMARQVSMSKYHFLRLFKIQYGVTPADYHIRMRIDRAVELLRDPAFGLKDIAQACGFSETSSFIRCFKRITGTTPAQYKKRAV